MNRRCRHAWRRFQSVRVDSLIAKITTDYPFLTEFWAKRLIRAYGTLAWDILGDATTAADLGQDFGATMSAREVSWLIKNEFVTSAEDIVWRRSKLGLRLDAAQVSKIENYIKTAT